MADVTFLGPSKNQAILTSHIEALSRAGKKTGVVNGNRIIPTDPASMAVIVEAGRIRVNGAPLDVIQGSPSANASHATLARIDIIYRDAAGDARVAAGTPDAIEDPKGLGNWRSYTKPVPPEGIPPGAILGAAYIPAEATSITTDRIWMFAGPVEDISTSVSAPGSDAISPSEQAVKELADTKINTSDIVTSVGNPGADNKVPSEQAVQEGLSSRAPAAKGVTNGDNHDHSGGDGGQIDHTTCSNAGTNTHAAIDIHLANQQNPHNTTAAQVGADITTGAVHAATTKTTPVDNDELGIVDSQAGYILKKLTWANLKATLKTYFDTLYILKSVLTTRGDILVRDASGPARLGKGATGQALLAGANDPVWTTRVWDVGYYFGDGSTAILAGEVGYPLRVACRIVGVEIREQGLISSTATVTVHVHDLGAAIGAAVATFSLNGTTYSEANLNLAVAAGKWVTVKVASPSGAKQLEAILKFEAV